MNIIFIPGLLCTEKMWGDLNLLRDQHTCVDADVYCFDSIKNMADGIIQQIDTSKKYIVIGSSMGGYVSLELAIRGYDWLEKLVLLNTTANAVEQATLPERQKAIAYAEQDNLDAILALSKGSCFLDKKEEFLGLEKQMAYQLGCKIYVNQQKAIINRVSYTNELDKIKTKTLIVSSKHDGVIDYRDSIQLFEKIRHAELVLLDQVGHLPTIENSQKTARMIKLFLEG